jgi:hypothetical protein
LLGNNHDAQSSQNQGYYQQQDDDFHNGSRKELVQDTLCTSDSNPNRHDAIEGNTSNALEKQLPACTTNRLEYVNS